jgi:hypothetical protein
MKPGNPVRGRMKGANSGEVFREMRGKAMALLPLRCRGFLMPALCLVYFR